MHNYMGRGLFIVLYGQNNLGKSTQLDLLEDVWKLIGREYRRVKYPVYDLEPTGPMINAILRQGVPATDEELQALFAQNRRDFEPTLVSWLEGGEDVIAEDYLGTGLAWGLTKGVSREFLDEVNKDLLIPDMSILLDGERFSSGIEKGHRHECAGTEIWEKGRRAHLELAKEFGWEVVNANQSKEKVLEDSLAALEERGLLR